MHYEETTLCSVHLWPNSHKPTVVSGITLKAGQQKSLAYAQPLWGLFKQNQIIQIFPAIQGKLTGGKVF